MNTSDVISPITISLKILAFLNIWVRIYLQDGVAFLTSSPLNIVISTPTLIHYFDPPWLFVDLTRFPTPLWTTGSCELMLAKFDPQISSCPTALVWTQALPKDSESRSHHKIAKQTAPGQYLFHSHVKLLVHMHHPYLFYCSSSPVFHYQACVLLVFVVFRSVIKVVVHSDQLLHDITQSASFNFMQISSSSWCMSALATIPPSTLMYNILLISDLRTFIDLACVCRSSIFCISYTTSPSFSLITLSIGCEDAAVGIFHEKVKLSSDLSNIVLRFECGA